MDDWSEIRFPPEVAEAWESGRRQGIQDAAREIERLREALETIAGPMACFSPHAGLAGSREGDLKAVARLALEGKWPLETETQPCG